MLSLRTSAPDGILYTCYGHLDIDLVEGVQRAFTRNVFKRCQLQPASYNDRLAYLGLERLELHRIHGDLIYMFKLMHNIVLSSLAQTLHFNNSITRGHDFKLFINRCNKIVFSTYFTNRIAPVWNSLPYDCFTVNSLTYFKRCLYNIDLSHLLKGTL